MKHSRLERYLKQATQGLQGKKRAAVILELRGNLEQHVKERMAFGIVEDRALEEILDDFGAPQLVSRGMWGVHMKPLLSKIGVGIGLVGLVGLSTLTASAANVRLFDDPQFPRGTSIWVSTDHLFQILGWTDTKVEVKGKTFTINKGSENLLTYMSDTEEFTKYWVKKHNGEKYISPRDTVNMLSQYKGSPVYFNNPVNPTFRVGDKTLTIGGEGQKVDLRGSIAMAVQGDLYDYINRYLISKKHYTSEISPGKGYQHYIRGNAKPNHPYLALWSGWNIDPSTKNKVLYLKVGILQSNTNGDFKFETSYREVYFANKWETLKNMKNNQILLVEMTGRLNQSK